MTNGLLTCRWWGETPASLGGTVRERWLARTLAPPTLICEEVLGGDAVQFEQVENGNQRKTNTKHSENGNNSLT